MAVPGKMVVSAGSKAPRSVQRGCRLALLVFSVAALGPTNPSGASAAVVNRDGQLWIGTWATAAQPARPASAPTFHNQTLRLIVHTSVAGEKIRIKLSNTFGDQPLVIGTARVARRTHAADIAPASDRSLAFGGHVSTTVPPRSMVVSDPVDVEVPALSDLAISIFFPQTAVAMTVHSLALQTNYVSAETGDATAQVTFAVAKTIATWPFLTGVDVVASSHGATVVAFGSSTTDGDGSTKDANRRWPDILAERLQKSSDGLAELGVLNEGIIGNRLLNDSPRTPTNPPPFEGATFTNAGLNLSFYTPERERARQAVNEWIRHGGTFDAVVDFDEALRDPTCPTRLLPAYADDDHLHVNDAGNLAQANAIPLTLFHRH